MQAPSLGEASLVATTDAAPWDFLERAKGAGDPVWDEGAGAWLVSSYDLIKEIGRADGIDWRSPFIPDDDRPPFGLAPDDYIWFMGHGSRRAITLLEGDDHHQLHRWWMRAFAPRVLARWRENVIAPVTTAAIERVIDEGRGELSNEFAERVGSRVIAAVMGLPWEDEEWLERLCELSAIRFELKQQLANPSPDQELVARAFAATREMNDMLVPIVESRRSGDGDDFISMVWREAPTIFGERYDEVDAMSMAQSAFEGASQTTQYSTANGLYLLMTNPGLQDRLRDGEETEIRNFVEEALRLYGPVLFRPRIAKHDVDLAGVRIRKGEMVISLTVSGNRDSEHYGCPMDVDLSRPAPRDHLTFWVGGKTCPGQALARVELEEIASQVVRRLPNLRLDPDAEPPRFDQLLFRRWAPLHALWDVAA